ncbi:MAG: RNA polymerase sigma-70 factor [Bacteroidota bacterium]
MKQDLLSDLELLELTKKGNEFAFSKLFDRYWKDLYRFGFDILHDDDQTKDAVQEVFCRIWINRTKLNVSNPKSYFIKAVKNRVLDQLKLNSFKEYDDQFLIDEPAVNHVEEAIEYRETNAHILSQLDQLPKKSKEIFFLSRYSNLSNQEIANRLSMSKRTVEWHISEALKRLRKSMQISYTLWLFLVNLFIK